MDKDRLLYVLKSYKKNNEEKYGLIALGIFGSFARDGASSLSDVDIVLQTKTPNFFNIVHIKEDLEKQLQLPVDIIRLRPGMNPHLKKRIDRDAVYV